MSEFDKWWEENYMNVSADRTEAEDIYNLGVKSQQAKIDELQEQLRIEMERGTEYFTDFHSDIAERDELQARTDEVLKACDNLRTDLIRENYVEYDKGWKDCATSIYHQLKGN